MVAPALPGPPCPRRTAMPATTTASSGSTGTAGGGPRKKKKGAPRPPAPDRPGTGARRGCRLRNVLVRIHRARLLPADERDHPHRRPLRQRRGQARRLRNPADLRGLRRRPVPRPGLRPGAGPLLGDGRTPPPDGGPALRDVRLRPGRDGLLPAHARLAQGRAGGVRHRPVRRDEEEPPGVRGRRERLPQGARRQGHLRRVRGPRPHQRLQAVPVDPRSTRWPG